MARKRMIDPSIWTDEGMAELEPRQQLLYIGLISNADDDGRVKGSPAAISLMLPTLYSTRDRRIIEEDLQSVLSCMTQLVRYEVDGRPYLAFLNYRQWQKIDKPTESHLPPPPDDSPESASNSTSTPDDSPTATGGFVEDSGSGSGALPLNRTEENRREGNRGADAPKPTPKRATQIPQNFTVTDALVKWGEGKGFTRAQLEGQVERFVDYYTSKGEARKDWNASFRTWMNNARDYGHLNRAPGTITVHKGGLADNQQIERPDLIGPARLAWERQRWIEANPEEARKRGMA